MEKVFPEHNTKEQGNFLEDNPIVEITKQAKRINQAN
jgi:hypothetical protein